MLKTRAYKNNLHHPLSFSLIVYLAAILFGAVKCKQWKKRRTRRTRYNLPSFSSWRNKAKGRVDTLLFIDCVILTCCEFDHRWVALFQFTHSKHSWGLPNLSFNRLRRDRRRWGRYPSPAFRSGILHTAFQGPNSQPWPSQATIHGLVRRLSTSGPSRPSSGHVWDEY